MTYLRLLYTFLAAISLFGCSTGSVSFREMSSAYREVVENYSNDNVLINIIRASKNMPMSFLDIPSVIGSGQVQASAGLSASIYGTQPGTVPGFFSPGPGSYAGGSASLSASNGFNFTQSSLDNSAFLTSFISPIKPETVQNLVTNDTFPKSVLYTMIIEKIQINGPDGKVLEEWINDPTKPNYKQFQLALNKLLLTGLSTEATVQKQVLSAPMDADTLNKNMQALVQSYSLPGVTVVPTKNLAGNKPAYQLVRITSQARMCLIGNKANSKLETQFSKEAFCNAITDPLQDPDKNLSDAKKNSLVIQLRSSQRIFNFLGGLVNYQNSPDGKIIRVKNSALFKDHPEYVDQEDNDINSFPFFTVNTNKSDDNPVAKVSYMGNTYTIPNNHKDSSAVVFSLLSGMLTLNKVNGSIPLSPAVLVK